MFDLLRNACLIPYRFDADGIKNPVIMTDGQGRLLLEYSSVAHEKEYRHFEEVYQRLGAGRKMYFAKAYRYSHCYDSHMEVEQQILEKNTGVLLIHELPDTVKKKETSSGICSCLGSDGKTGKESAYGFCFLRPGHIDGK